MSKAAASSNPPSSTRSSGCAPYRAERHRQRQHRDGRGLLRRPSRRKNEVPLGIGAKCHIEGAILDKNVRIGEGTVIKPFPRGTDIDAARGSCAMASWSSPKTPPSCRTRRSGWMSRKFRTNVILNRCHPAVGVSRERIAILPQNRQRFCFFYPTPNASENACPKHLPNPNRSPHTGTHSPRRMC